MRFLYPYVFLIPLVIVGAALARRAQRAAVAHPQVAMLREIRPSMRQLLRGPVLTLLSLAALLFLSVAAARPQRVRVFDEPSMSRNLMFALDLSKSMSADDFEMNDRYTSRLGGVKSVMNEFIKNRKDDRIGVVVFGENAYVQSPLTLDHELVAQLVSHLQVGIAGDGTAIGDGLGMAIKRMLDIPGEAKAIILMTDGVSNAGQVNPIKAAKVARELGVKIYPIGIGSREGVIPQAGGMFFARPQIVPADFDEATLKKIADITGGLYFHATSTQGLQGIYEEIDKLDKTKSDAPMHEIAEELFPDFALAGLLCYLLYIMLANTYFLKLP